MPTPLVSVSVLALPRLRSLAALAWLLAAGASCTRHGLVDTVMTSAYRFEPGGAPLPAGAPRVRLLAGDLHCHVSPPDDPSDVERSLEQTVALARREHLDFVVLTPHVPAGFFADPVAREQVRASQRELRRRIDALALRDLLLVPGFEHTDHTYGHLGMAFADLDAVLDDLPLAEARAHPERFFERWVARGGTLVVHHPLVTPVPGGLVSMARADLSWRAWTSTEPLPPEVRAAHRLAFGFEAYNLAAAQLRDRYLLGSEGRSLIATLQRIDRTILEERRRLVPVGGSDSHSQHLRAATFVLADGATPAELRAALLAGRVCVRAPEACRVEARGERGGWRPVGASLRSDGAVALRSPAGAARFVVAGRVVATAEAGAVVRLAVPRERCTVVRAIVGDGFSAPLYVNCPFAGPPAG